MFQCLGLGHVESGGCGEDWWHPECLMGLPKEQHGVEKEEAATVKGDDNDVKAETVKIEVGASGVPLGDSLLNGVDPVAEIVTAPEEAPLPPGFPAEDDFDHLICYKCVDANPWIRAYAGSQGFLKPVFNNASSSAIKPVAAENGKRKAEDTEDSSAIKRVKVEDISDESAETKTTTESTTEAPKSAKHTSLSNPPNGSFSIFVKEDFREHFCRCPECFPRLAKYPQLLEEEEAYEPPVSESDAGEANGGGSVGTGSILERGEAALSTMDRMRAIEGVMAYNHLRDKVKTFLQPFAESGQAVGAEDVKAYFAKLRGDEEAMRLAANGADQSGDGGSNRKEQSGY